MIPIWLLAVMSFFRSICEPLLCTGKSEWYTYLVCRSNACRGHVRSYGRKLHGLGRKKSHTLYETLGVLPTATQTEIKNAYYDLALQYHPDKSINSKDQEVFREISEAYQVLANVQARKKYDKEIGAYFTMRGSEKKETIRPVWRLMDDRLVNIDARKIKKGESFVRYVSLICSILDIPVRVVNIRSSSSVHGIPAAEMRAVMLLRQICNGTLSGTTGSTSLTFLPSDIQCGRLHINSYQFGTVCSLIPLASPLLMCAPPPRVGCSNVMLLNGPTYAYNGLHIDHISKVYRPVMNRFGMDVHLEVKKRGYLPYGSGSVVIRSYPIRSFKSVEIVDPGLVTKITGRAFVAGGKPVKIAQQMAKEAHNILKSRFPKVEIMIDSLRESNSRADGTGQGLLIVAETSTSCVFSGAGLWKKGVETETVVSSAVKQLLRNLNSGGCVDDWMQEQLVIPMCLAKGRSIVRIGPLTPETKAALRAVRALTKVRFQVVEEKDLSSGLRTNLIKCEGLGFTNLYF